MSTAIKICGITRLEDALAAARAGADAIGLVFHAASPRYVTAARAAQILRVLPSEVTTVGLFVNASADEVRAVLAEARVELLQFHGEESPEFCRQFGQPYVKAVRMGRGVNLIQYARTYHDAKALLLDTLVEGVQGGSGITFDWSLIPHDLSLPIILSGGLTPENVTEAVRRVRPLAVDVSSGVESGKGIKDASRIAAFIRGVRNADV